ncbi:MAG: hypothetical protein AAB974_02430 [Patescibacteria group bacterium]
MSVVTQESHTRIAPFARIRHSALAGDAAPYFDPAVLGFAPRDISEIEDERLKWAIVNGIEQPFLDCEDAGALAVDLEKVGQGLFSERWCRVVVTAVRAARLERHIADVLDSCKSGYCEFALRPGDRKELVIVPQGMGGPYAPQPYLLAARIINALRDRLENATLTGEETVNGALYGCEATVAVVSDPEGFRVPRHPVVLALGVSYRF